MDVRQFAFLARQPSAALMPRNSFFGLPKRGGQRSNKAASLHIRDSHS